MLTDQTSERWTCLAESAGKTILWNETEIACRLYRDGLTEKLFFVFDFAGETEDVLATNHFRVTYNGETKGFERLEDFSSPVCALTYADGVCALRFRLMAEEDVMTVDGAACREIRFPFTWYDTLPVLHWNANLYANYQNIVTWSMDAPAGRLASPGRAAFCIRRQDEEIFTKRAETTLRPGVTGWSIVLEPEDLGAYYYFDVEYATYAEKDGAPLTRNRLQTPVGCADRDGGIPLPPALTTGAVMRGGRVRLVWTAAADPLYTLRYFDLQRAVSDENGAAPEWELLYSGTGLQFTDTPPDAGYVRFRVRGRVSSREASPWTDTGWLREAVSNLYVGVAGKPVAVAAVRIGQKAALPYGYCGGETKE